MQTDWATFGLAATKRLDVSDGVRALTTSDASLATATWRTEFNISGSGVLHSVGWYNVQGAKESWLRVTVDGGTPQILGDTGTTYGLVGLGAYGGSPPCYGQLHLGSVRFKTSLVVEVYNNYFAAATIRSGIVYSLR